LFGLASFTIEQRTKEIAIRKVIGASTANIGVLLCKESTRWVLMANIIAWPLAYYVMNNWLRDFAYRITIGLEIFFLAGLLALTIALLTISYHIVLLQPIIVLKKSGNTEI
jgi:putative ABC transport system permease protein